MRLVEIARLLLTKPWLKLVAAVDVDPQNLAEHGRQVLHRLKVQVDQLEFVALGHAGQHVIAERLEPRAVPRA